MTIDISRAMQELMPDAQWSCNANDYSQIVMHDGRRKPALKDLEDAYKVYQERRASEPEPKTVEQRVAELEAKVSVLQEKLQSSKIVL